MRLVSHVTVPMRALINGKIDHLISSVPVNNIIDKMTGSYGHVDSLNTSEGKNLSPSSDDILTPV